MVIDPGIEFKTVERNSLSTDRDLSEVRADFGVEAVTIHTEVAGGVAEAEEPRGNEYGACWFLICDHSRLSAQGRRQLFLHVHAQVRG